MLFERPKINTRADKIVGRCRGEGFTIAELLISLAITAMLLAAVATAFNAAAVNYRENEDMFKCVNSARQALMRMTNQLRTADAVDPNAAANECSLITADGEDLTYSYNSSENKLYLITNDVTTDADYELCDNVMAMTFTKTTGVSGSVTYVKSVQISITVQEANNTKTLAAAAVVRRNLD